MSTTIGQVPPRMRKPSVGTRRVRPQSRPSTKKLEFELDIAVVENLNFQRHTFLPVRSRAPEIN